MMSPEGTADAAEPPEVVALTAVLPKAVVLASAPCVVVAPSNILSACHVTVKGTVAELFLYSDGTIVEPPEVAASAADPLELSMVHTYELLSCPGYRSRL
ncbi:hypothetical protein ABG768_000326 [Culter alburnus]|uniref:Uncharacterized protein n=1 Tax=Culter alburnus TaxID=194366 RepID=A0AAW2B6T5_CULAL